ncbi:MAG: TRCF domain-containing protein, partial [Candidatus Binataceae bacterium]
RLARAESHGDLDDLRDELRDRFGPVPTLVENLVAAMNVRRVMKEMMIVSAVVKGKELEVRFHGDAPVDTARLAALADRNRRTMKLTPSFQVIARLETAPYEQLFAQIDGVLQALATCETLESRSPHPASEAVN